MSHAFVHEAAHAVAALDRGIRFNRVAIKHPSSWVSPPEGGATLGGVEMSASNPSAWVSRNPVHALEFCLAGAVAEQSALDHALPGSFTGDLRVWRTGMGATAPLDESQVAELLGRSLSAVKNQTASWVVDNWSRIRAVACGLAGIENVVEVACLEFSESWVLSESQVASLAA
jgi:hypothetical protein